LAAQLTHIERILVRGRRLPTSGHTLPCDGG